MKKTNNIVKVIIVILIVLNLISAVLFSTKKLEITISTSNSMEPLIMTHSLMIVESLSHFKNVRVGDIISYRLTEEDSKISKAGTMVVMHQIVEIDDNGKIITKGINNKQIDYFEILEENYENKYLIGFNKTAYIIESLLNQGFTVKEINTIIVSCILFFNILVSICLTLFLMRRQIKWLICKVKSRVKRFI